MRNKNGEDDISEYMAADIMAVTKIISNVKPAPCIPMSLMTSSGYYHIMNN